MTSYQKIPQQKSETYKLWLRTQPCWICGTFANTNIDVVPAHQNLGYGKMGGKSHDMLALPECTACHFTEHNDPEKYKELLSHLDGLDRDAAKKSIILMHIWRFLTQ